MGVHKGFVDHAIFSPPFILSKSKGFSGGSSNALGLRAEGAITVISTEP